MPGPYRKACNIPSRHLMPPFLVRGITLAALLSACGRLGFEERVVPSDITGAQPGPAVDRDASPAPDETGTDASTAQPQPGADSGIDAGRLATDTAVPPPPGTQLEWIQLVGGTFEMGSTAMANSQPVHAVTVPTFEMGRTEVTVAQYTACMDAGACSAPSAFSPSCYAVDAEYDDYPVNCVSHDQSAEFCAWTGGRLPSEAEWEYAARSRGKAQIFPWGDTPASCNTAILSIGGDGCGTMLPWPVCSVPLGSTSEGLCDMTGNLFEWTLDGWHATYDGAPTDGSAWPGSNKVVRGGNFMSGVWTSSQRGIYFGSTYLNFFIGFRCVR